MVSFLIKNERRVEDKLESNTMNDLSLLSAAIFSVMMGVLGAHLFQFLYLALHKLYNPNMEYMCGLLGMSLGILSGYFAMVYLNERD